MRRGFNFNSIPAAKLRRSSFDLSHEFKSTLPMGQLIPFLCMEGLPGDTFKMKISQLTRFMALQSPMMQRVDLKFEFYKVPIRLIYKDWENFITGGVDGQAAPSMCQMDLDELHNDASGYLLNKFKTNSLAQFLGIPVPVYFDYDTETWKYYEWSNINTESTKISLLPFNAYHKIYNDYYRDENIIPETPIWDESGALSGDDLIDYLDKGYFDLHRRAWRKDYFTSALNDPQRGQAVAIGLAGTAPVTAAGTIPGQSYDPSLTYVGSDPQGDKWTTGNHYDAYMEAGALEDGQRNFTMEVKDKSSADNPLSQQAYLPGLDVSVEGSADLSGISAVGIIALRTAFRLQQFLERNNIAGARLVESVLAHFGVRSSDARLQRAELLGRFSMPVTVSPVDSTADTAGAAVGEQAGIAKSVGGSGYVTTFCEEHCIIMGLVSIMPQASYCQGLSRMWQRFDKFDYFWPEFQNIGEQAVKNQEIMLAWQDNNVKNNADFGYQARYSDYKYQPDRICGDLATNLSYWHMGRLFDDVPGLNREFIECDPTDRVFAVKESLSTSKVIGDFWLTIKALRPMAKYSTPKIC